MWEVGDFSCVTDPYLAALKGCFLVATLHGARTSRDSIANAGMEYTVSSQLTGEIIYLTILADQQHYLQICFIFQTFRI